MIVRFVDVSRITNNHFLNFYFMVPVFVVFTFMNEILACFF